MVAWMVGHTSSIPSYSYFLHFLVENVFNNNNRRYCVERTAFVSLDMDIMCFVVCPVFMDAKDFTPKYIISLEGESRM